MYTRNKLRFLRRSMITECNGSSQIVFAAENP